MSGRCGKKSLLFSVCVARELGPDWTHFSSTLAFRAQPSRIPKAPSNHAGSNRAFGDSGGRGGGGGGDSRPHWCVVGGAKVEELGGARPKGLVTRRRIERKGNLKRSLCIFLSLAKISLIAAQRPIFPLTILFSRLKELSYFGPGVQFSALTSLKFILEPLSLRVYDNKKTTT